MEAVNESGTADINLTETTYLKNDYPVNITSDGTSTVSLYPSLPKQLKISFHAAGESFPDDSVPFGKITFESKSTKKTEYELPIIFRF